MIKRAESYRSWADIEDLANGFESLTSGFEQHKVTAASAFQELYNHIERFKKEITSKQVDTSSSFN
jgi:glutaredoxin-related protein